MTRNSSPRRPLGPFVAALLPLVVLACGGDYPNSTFQPTTEFNREVTGLWNAMMLWGTVVFVIVESILVYTIIKYRRRPGAPEPLRIHGNTALELTWTIAPALILVFIAVPTVRTIFKTQAKAPSSALQVEVIGHQWWWEFRYPDYGFATANELYLPYGRAVNFALRTADVLHSFWIPALSGKRDLISNRTNYLWFTPDSTGEAAFNGSCNEYCGASHANMRFRVFTVAATDFEKWTAQQKANAAFPPAPAMPAPTPDAATTARPVSNPAGSPRGATAQTTPRPANAAPPPAPAPAAAPLPDEAFRFPSAKIPAHVMPKTPLPVGLNFPENLLAAGDAQRGFQTYSRSACIGCHKVRGNPMSVGVIGPDLTHIGSRFTIGGGLYPNDDAHMARWIKNARRMKPLSFASMPTLGMGETDPITKTTITKSLGGLTDDQIADIVAYLRSLK
jgi:cytochrome c oxidase subunit 2